MELEFIIQNLIYSKREGDYWDFKGEPHESNIDLLHDIISLANSTHRGDRYLIIGVADPTKGCKIKGLTKGQNNRKSQTNFIDFLRSKDFAGENRPEVELHTLNIEDIEIDVLIIFDRPYKPYYLIKDFCNNSERNRIVRANYIYTRINDTNTPIDKSADIGKIEQMWKQRFGLDLSPLEKMKQLLIQPDQWFKDIGNKSYAYHTLFPEFRIEFSDVSPCYDVYRYFYTNIKSFVGTAFFYFHSTILFELEYIYCDEMRISLAAPSPQYIRMGNYENWYYFFEKDDINGLFLYFMSNGFQIMTSRSWQNPFILFKNKSERVAFNQYLENNVTTLDKITNTLSGNMAKDMMKKNKDESRIDPVFIDKVKQIYEQWALITK
jgi:hypothetical protein